MSNKELLISEIEHTPEPLIEELLDFLRYLRLKMKNGNIETAIASESSLKKDWTKPEEDKAWQNL